jgi:hypothetical protein
VESSCQIGNEPSGSIKCWESAKWLHNLWPLERYSAPQSYLVMGLYGMYRESVTFKVNNFVSCYIQKFRNILKRKCQYL